MTDSLPPRHTPPWSTWMVAAVGVALLLPVLWPRLQPSEKPRWFDTDMSAPHPFTDNANVQRFEQALRQLHPELNKQHPIFIRFTQQHCQCESLVDSYHELMTPLWHKEGFQVLTLDETDMNQLAKGGLKDVYRWIPSTPAVMVLDGSSGLAYFGPYHQTGICNSKNSFLEPVLEAVRDHRPMSIVNTLVQGCFCHYPLASATSPQ